MWFLITLACYFAIGVIYSSWVVARRIEDGEILWERWDAKVLFIRIIVLWWWEMGWAVRDYLRRED